MVTGETSTGGVLVSGEATVVSTITVGVCLFRNTRMSGAGQAASARSASRLTSAA
jgi:hypothetical protein